ncbi:MAG TPA: MFS transporter [Steroidobacteraceae bacterium]|nr:MFS transporter [Steroidobacteraceae bacterium]HRX87999.1 MFS transporter [Steroidobacteraceae bacterium]
MNKRIFVLWLIVLIDLIGFGLTTPSFPLVMKQLDADPFWLTFAGPGVYSLFQFLFTPVWGRLSDAYGRRPILMLSMLGALVSYLVMAHADSVWLLILTRAIGGIMSGNIGAAFAYVTDVTEPKERAKSLGILASAFGIGFMLGPLIGGPLGTIGSELVSLRWPGYVAAALSTLAFLGTWLLLSESLPPANRKPFGATGRRAGHSPWKTLLSRPVLISIVATTFMIGTASAMMQSVYPIWAFDTHGHNSKLVGVAFALLALLAVIAQAGLTGTLARRVGERGVGVLGIAGFGIGLAMISFVHYPAVLWSGLAVMGLGYGLTNPAFTSLASFQASPQERGAVMGVFQSGTSLGRVIGPALSGPIYMGMSHAGPFLTATLLCVPALWLILRVPEPTQGARSGA